MSVPSPPCTRAQAQGIYRPGPSSAFSLRHSHTVVSRIVQRKLCGGGAPVSVHEAMRRLRHAHAAPCAGAAAVFNLTHAPDGSCCVATLSTGVATMLDPRTAAPVGDLRGHSSGVNVAQFWGPWIVTGSDDCTAMLWDRRNTSTPCMTFDGHSGWVKNVEAVDDRLLLTSAFDGTLRLVRTRPDAKACCVCVWGGDTCGSSSMFCKCVGGSVCLCGYVSVWTVGRQNRVWHAYGRRAIFPG